MMKNFEKWEKEIKEIVNSNKPIAVVNNKPCVCNPQCSKCRFNKSNGDMRGCVVKGFEWLYEEYKEPIKMTRLDYELLKFVQKQGAKYICRDKSGLLNIFNKCPCIGVDKKTWVSGGNCSYFSYFTNKLFPFVTWESQKYYVIEDVLNNCEVTDNVH